MQPIKSNLLTNPTPCKTRAHVAAKLGISLRDLKRRMEKTNNRITHGLLTHKGQNLIYQLCGKSLRDIGHNGVCRHYHGASIDS